MKLHFAFFALLFFTLAATAPLQAQDEFEVPRKYKLKKAEDYKEYEPVVIGAAQWLEETPLDKEKGKREKVNAFVLQWIMGSPNVTVEITEATMELFDENPDLLAVFMARYAANSLQSGGRSSKFDDTKAALTSVIKVYRNGNGAKKDRQVEKLLKLYDKGELDDYITGTLRIKKS